MNMSCLVLATWFYGCDAAFDVHVSVNVHYLIALQVSISSCRLRSHGAWMTGPEI